MLKKQKTKRSKVTTLVNFILDKSGSMGSIQDSVISGFNEYINSLRNKKGTFKFSLTMFDTESIETPYVDVDIDSVKNLSRDTYVPNAGTPLYDAVVDTIEAIYEKVQNKKNYAIVTVIMTDGEENSSRKHDQKCMKDLIHKLESEGNWTFTFMGANIDAYEAAHQFGISMGNTVTWQSTLAGTQNAFRGFADATANYAMVMSVAGGGGGSGVLNTKSFYRKEDRDLIEKGDDKNVT